MAELLQTWLNSEIELSRVRVAPRIRPDFAMAHTPSYGKQIGQLNLLRCHNEDINSIYVAGRTV